LKVAAAAKGFFVNDLAKNIILWIVIAIVLLTVFQSFGTGGRQAAIASATTTNRFSNRFLLGGASRRRP